VLEYWSDGMTEKNGILEYWNKGTRGDKIAKMFGEALWY
jgi:hypothetical protein